MIPTVLRFAGCRALLAVLSFFPLVCPVRSESLPPGNWLATVGTTITNAAGEEWVYLFWQPSDPSAFGSKTLAIYAKPGNTRSTRQFLQTGIAAVQTDPRVIRPMLERAAAVGDDLAELDEHLTGLFQNVVPAPGVSLAEKLAAVAHGFSSDPSLGSRMLLLSRRHPGAAMAFGLAHAEPYASTNSTQMTYELREFNVEQSRATTVLARVVLTRGAPLQLPAPGPVIEVPTNGPTADLLARIRWSTPDELRRLTPAMNGYNVYRVERSRAVALGLTNGAAPGVLAQLALSDPSVERVNVQPVMLPKEFTAATAADLVADPSTAFVTDTRDRHRGGLGFRDGDQFCYLVAARDILGRDGAASVPGCVTFCDRIPPPIPQGLRSANDFVIEGAGATNGRQRIRLTWTPDAGAASNRTAGYRLYRWNRREDLHRPDVRPTLVATVPHRAGTTLSELDQTPDAPDVSRAGTVFWYTVRSFKNTACGDLESADGAPAKAIPRDREGPIASAPKLVIRRPELGATFRAISIEGGATNLPAGANRYWIRATRTNREIAWVEVAVNDPALEGGTARLGRHYFPRYGNGGGLPHATLMSDGEIDWAYLSPTAAGVSATVRFGLANGITSETWTHTLPAAQPAYATGAEIGLAAAWNLAPAGNDRTHHPVSITPGAPAGAVTGVGVLIPHTGDTHHWRLYRRLDRGPLLLVSEGDAPNPAKRRSDESKGAIGDVAVTDGSMPANTAMATYYSQLLDRDGNEGPLLAAESILIAAPPVAPTLLGVTAVVDTNTAASTLTVSWSGAPYGLARYRIWVGNPARGSLPLLRTGTNGILSKSAKALRNPTVIDLDPMTLVYREYVHSGGTTNLLSVPHDTARIGMRTGEGPIHSADIPRASVASDLYLIVEAVGLDGSVGEASNTLVLPAGASDATLATGVPWPKRALPTVREDFTGSALKFEAVRLKRGSVDGTADGDFDGIGIAIGYTSIVPRSGATPKEGRDAFLNGGINPVSKLFNDPETGLPLFGRDFLTFDAQALPLPRVELSEVYLVQPLVSAALYRQQVPSTAYPQPAGDLVQVTPKMSGIAHRHYTNSIPLNAGVNLPATQVLDPFIRVFRQPNTHGIYLIDTQPLIEGASYRYHLVRFAENGEMIDSLPTPPITATASE